MARTFRLCQGTGQRRRCVYFAATSASHFVSAGRAALRRLAPDGSTPVTLAVPTLYAGPVTRAVLPSWQVVPGGLLSLHPAYAEEQLASRALVYWREWEDEQERAAGRSDRANETDT